MYKSTGDVSSNSPGDWDRILADALTAVSNSANDRYTNYDLTKGLNSPITELSDATSRKSQIDDKEPRPNINSRDYGALSIQNAGFVYQMIGGDGGSISGKKGTDFAKAVRTEMLWYSSNQYLDFSNSKRWSLSDPFYDRNPGFFIACWLNTLVNAYDYTKESSVYSSSEKAKIETWLLNASKFYYSMLVKYTKLVFPNYASNEYSVTANSWPDNLRGEAWTGSSYIGYGINESYSNRTTAMWRFVMRASILLQDNSTHASQAKTQISAAKRWVKEWITFGTFADGTFADFHRGSTSYPQKGLSYTSVALGSIIDMVDAYVRHQQSDSDYENLYEWELKPGTSEYNKYFPSSTKGRAWRKSLELSEAKGIKKIITTYLKHFDGSYGSTRRWGSYVIDGYSAPSTAPRKIEMDRWVSLANLYYQDDYIKSVYTRTKSGTKGYNSNPTGAGSYPINIGSWGSHPGTLFMFGQMEGKAWPYSGSSSKPATTKILSVASSMDMGEVTLGESVTKEVTIQNTGNSTLTISKITSNSSQFSASYSGTIAANGKTTFKVTYKPAAVGSHDAELEITSDKTSGSNLISLSGNAVAEKTDETNTGDSSGDNAGIEVSILLEAESSDYQIITDSGSKSKVQPSSGSSVLSDGQGLNLYDKGDKVRYTFTLENDGLYQINVRVRSGNVSSSTAYWPNGYNFYLDRADIELEGDKSTLSSRSGSFGISYFGTMKSEQEELSAGTHTLDIEALSSWGMIDYIEVVGVSSGSGSTDDNSSEETPTDNSNDSEEEYTSGIIEAETNYTTVSDKGSKSKVKVISSDIFSNDAAVTLYDVGDKIKFSFDIPETSYYVVRIRLRAGNYFNYTAYIPDGYKYYIEGVKEEFTILDGSVSGLVSNFGKSTWGTVESALKQYEPGTYSLAIESAISWAMVDYIEIVEINDPSYKNSSDISDDAVASAEILMDVYPNPATEYINVSIDTEISETGQIHLIDLNGRILYSDEITSYDTEKTINVSQINKGFYLINVQLGSQKIVKRIVLQ